MDLANYEFPDEVKAMKNYKSLKTGWGKLPDHVRKLIIDGNTFTYIPKYNAIRTRITEEEYQAIANLCRGKKTPGNYFAKITSKANLERTLIHIRRILNRSVEAIKYIVKILGSRPKTFIGFVADKIAEGKYPMNQVVNMVDLAAKKKQPDRYLIGILKRGYNGQN